jgi:hypothetical protein
MRRMEVNTFKEKTKVPNDEDVRHSLGKTFPLWEQVKIEALSSYPGAIQEWNFPGVKYGWSFRIKDKKRAIIYMIPREGFFEVAFVFGQKGSLAVYESEVQEDLKEQLRGAKLYGEGRGLKFEVKEKSIMKSVKILIQIKLRN